MKKWNLSLLRHLLILSICTFFSGATLAQEESKQAPASTQANQACYDQGVGDSCEYVNKLGQNESGICQVDSSSTGKLTCVPLH